MLKILHVVPSYYPAVRYGGPIRSVHGLAAAQVQLGHHVTVFTTNVDGPGVSDVPVDEPVIKNGVHVHYFPVPWLRRLYWSPAMAKALHVQMTSADIVHLHSVFLWPTFAAARAASAARVPYFLAPRGMLVRQLINAKSRWVKKTWIALVERKTMRHAAGLHVTTELEEFDVRALNLPMPPVYCVPNGVELPDEIVPLSDCPFTSLPDKYILYIGRINWKKGLHRLIESLVKIPPEFSLVLAGNDEEGYRAKLDKLADRLGVKQRIIFLGHVGDRYKWTLYRHARVFVLPSTSENFGNVVIEAMAMACPVVVTPGVGVADLVHRVQCGTVTDNEPAALARAVCAIGVDEHAARTMGRRGEQAVRETLTWRSVARQMIDAYEEVLSAQDVRLVTQPS
ncbi:MAG TPA: glycosyltransferase [Steroidobacteraceae bacterium]|nr:glycosyltransferase [Steroidobacteraceae bacterium]